MSPTEKAIFAHALTSHEQSLARLHMILDELAPSDDERARVGRLIRAASEEVARAVTAAGLHPLDPHGANIAQPNAGGQSA